MTLELLLQFGAQAVKATTDDGQATWYALETPKTFFVREAADGKATRKLCDSERTTMNSVLGMLAAINT